MATRTLPARDSKGRFLPRYASDRPDWVQLAVPTVEPETVKPLVELRREVIAPVTAPAPELRREVIAPVTRRQARAAMRVWIGNAALLAGLAAGCAAWAHHLGII